MKPALFLAFVVVFTALWSCQTKTVAPQQSRTQKAVFIILDGIPADAIERLHPPTLDSIAKAGGYCRAYVGGNAGTYTETPTISAPGYMSLLAATWGNKHNVWDNEEQSPNYHYWNLFHTAKAADPQLKIAIFSTWRDNRTVLVGEGKPLAGGFRFDYAFDGLELDTVRFPQDTQSRYIAQIDELVADTAGAYIAANAPDLSWVYLQYTDDIGHAFGDSPEMDAAILKADNQVKRIWEAVKKRQSMGEEWMLVVTTDHGRDAATGKEHGGQSARERTTWMVCNTPDLNARFADGNLPIVDIAPSILRHLRIAPPETIAWEMDGVPFIGAVSADSLDIRFVDKSSLQLQWRSLSDEGEAEVFITFGNKFRSGGMDKYTSLGKVLVKSENLVLKLTDAQLAQFKKQMVLKVLFKAPENTLNAWIVLN